MDGIPYIVWMAFSPSFAMDFSSGIWPAFKSRILLISDCFTIPRQYKSAVDGWLYHSFRSVVNGGGCDLHLVSILIRKFSLLTNRRSFSFFTSITFCIQDSDPLSIIDWMYGCTTCTYSWAVSLMRTWPNVGMARVIWCGEAGEISSILNDVPNLVSVLIMLSLEVVASALHCWAFGIAS